MNRFFAGLFFVLTAEAALAQAQGPGTDSEERARIVAERARAEALFAQQEKACYGQFAVNDCINAARTGRRTTLADLRRQEVSLNDAQRRRKGADRIRSIEEKNESLKAERASDDRAKAVESAKLREERAAQKTADKASAPHGAKPVAPRAPKTAPQPSAEAQRKNAERLQEAQARRERIEKRQKERTKPPAASLPVPP